MSPMTVIGVSASHEGAVSKAGKPYRIGQVHTMVPLAPPINPGGVEKGSVGTTYPCDPEVVKRIAHLPFPVTCDVEVQTVARFGKREDTVIDVKPVEIVKKAA